MSRIICFGAGGHAAVLLDALFEIGRSRPVQVVGLLAKTDLPGGLFGVNVLGDDDDIERAVKQSGADSFTVGIGMARGGNPLREKAYALGRSHGLEPFTVIHPSAIVSARAEIAAGACVLAGAVVQPRARIGENAIINTCASIDHDCVIGAHAHIAPGATLSGNVNVGRTVHIGAGASVRNGISIGDNATIGSGAALVSDCPAGATMIGVPARVTEKTDWIELKQT
jgi:sugar O-acyltransferase (sialic acid O-acetyltransferase NeuD family)